VIALADHGNMKLHQMDVNIVFLNGKLREEAFIRQSERFIELGKEYFACRLNNLHIVGILPLMTI